MPIKSVKQMVDEANRQIEVMDPQAAMAAAKDEGALFVDIRDVRELAREGRVDGAKHAPRGMLEFWFAPDSPYHKETYADASRKYILFCAMGWRSALATKTLKDMGFENVAHVDGGFAALKDAGATILKE